MEREITEVYCGNGKGKTTLAVGRGAALCYTGKKCDHHTVPQGQGTQRTGFP